jgi:hypothetical protein
MFEVAAISHRQRVKRRRARLTDEDHRIHAIVQFGGVVRVLKDVRGVIVESFSTMDGVDCTQNITHLERAELVDPFALQQDAKEAADARIAWQRVPVATRARLRKRKRKDRP